eukprot:5644081-Amphidinium_carterae.3
MSDVEGLVRAQCYASIDDAGNCCHVASALTAGVEMPGECEGHKRVYLTLVQLFRLRDTCPSCKGHLASLLRLIGASIDGRAGTWRNGLVNLPELMGPSGVKRRRVDPHVKANILATAQKDERKRAWIASEESSRLYSAQLVFANAPCIASTFDAGRIGKPQKDCMVHWLLVPGEEVAYSLPPQFFARPSSHATLSQACAIGAVHKLGDSLFGAGVEGGVPGMHADTEGTSTRPTPSAQLTHENGSQCGEHRPGSSRESRDSWEEAALGDDEEETRRGHLNAIAFSSQLPGLMLASLQWRYSWFSFTTSCFPPPGQKGGCIPWRAHTHSVLDGPRDSRHELSGQDLASLASIDIVECKLEARVGKGLQRKA